MKLKIEMEHKIQRNTKQDEKPKEKTLRNVFYYIPNLINYFRLYLVILGSFLDILFNFKLINVFFYIFSHFLDLYDECIARWLNQTSKFGVVLDYTVDIISEAIWFMQLFPLVSKDVKIFMVYMIIIDIFGLVFCVYNSARGTYWKGTECRPKLQNYFINDKGYTRLGYTVVLWYQIFWGFLYLSYFYYIPCILLVVLSVPMFMEAASLTMILYEQLLLFRE